MNTHKNSSKTHKITLDQIRFAMLFALPAVLFCGYYPLFLLGQNNSMNFKLSLPLIWLFVFAIISIPTFIRQFKKALKARQIWPFTIALPLYLSLSIIWSPNPLRATLTAGIFWCIFISIPSIITITKNITNKQRKQLIWTILITSVVFSLWCWIQCLLDIIGIDRSSTLLCAGCTYQSFGFPHPNGMAIEPQFMGNLLIAPTLLALWCIKSKLISPKNTRLKILLIAIAFFLCATLFLTFSRGAIYAFGIGLLVMIVWSIVQKRFHLSQIIIPICAFLFTLCAQGLMATAAPTHENFTTGVTKALHQLSLGVIDIRQTEDTSSVEVTEITENSEVANTEAVASENTATSAKPEFSGYVEQSTDVRVNLTNYALRLWTSSPKILIFGTGLGGAGTALNQAFPEEVTSAKEIVQNQYASLLLETGIVGILLAGLFLVVAIMQLWKSQRRPLLISILVAYLVSLFFFSGLPSALQVYLWLPLLDFLVLVASFTNSSVDQDSRNNDNWQSD